MKKLKVLSIASVLSVSAGTMWAMEGTSPTKEDRPLSSELEGLRRQIQSKLPAELKLKIILELPSGYQQALASAILREITEGKGARYDLGETQIDQLRELLRGPLAVAIQNKNVKEVRELLSFGVDPDFTFELYEGGSSTPLIEAAFTANEDVFKLVFEAIKRDLPKFEMEEMLKNAINRGGDSIVRLILQRVPEAVNWKFDDQGVQISFLADAVRGLNPAVVQAFLDQKGVNVNLADESGVTPLHIAMDLFNSRFSFSEPKSKERDIVQALLKAGADPMLKTVKGVTPLGTITDPEKMKIVKGLIEEARVKKETEGLAGRIKAKGEALLGRFRKK